MHGPWALISLVSFDQRRKAPEGVTRKWSRTAGAPPRGRAFSLGGVQRFGVGRACVIGSPALVRVMGTCWLAGPCVNLKFCVRCALPPFLYPAFLSFGKSLFECVEMVDTEADSTRYDSESSAVKVFEEHLKII